MFLLVLNFVELERHDDHFRGLIEKAQSNNAKLRYLATLVDGKASIRLVMVTTESPFYNLASTDNMIDFKPLGIKKDRWLYRDQALVPM